MYPSGSDCSSYTDQGISSSKDIVPECGQCPINQGPTWAGLDVVSSTLAREHWDERVPEQRFPVHFNSPMVLTHETHNDEGMGCQACTDPRTSSHWGANGNNMPEGNWSDPHWSPCCLPESSCTQDCSGSGVQQHMSRGGDSGCCDSTGDLLVNDGSGGYDICQPFPTDCQVSDYILIAIIEVIALIKYTLV